MLGTSRQRVDHSGAYLGVAGVAEVLLGKTIQERGHGHILGRVIHVMNPDRQGLGKIIRFDVGACINQVPDECAPLGFVLQMGPQ